MVGSLLVGLAFALGHHYFYQHWNRRLVSSDDQQEWLTRIGTGFAFLVKMFWAIAASTAYIQCLWLSLGSEEVRIGNVDSMFDILGNAWKFLDVKLWLRHPFLAALAGATW